MKKLFLVLAVLFTSTVCTFAANYNYEFDLSYTFASREVQTGSSGILAEDSPIGVTGNGAFYFCSPNQYVDIGAGINFGFEGFNALNSTPCTGMVISAGFAPVFRFNFGSFTSFYVAPGFEAEEIKANNGSGILSAIDVLFELDAGYRGWFVTNETYNMGVCAGYKIGVPFAGTIRYGNSADTIFGGTNQKLYLGLCMNFGTKSDAKRATFRKVN